MTPLYPYVNDRWDAAPDVFRIIGRQPNGPSRQQTICRRPGEDDAAFCKRAQFEAECMVRYFYGVAGVTFPRVVIQCIYDVPPNPALFDDDRDNTLRCFWSLALTPDAPPKAAEIALKALGNFYGWSDDAPPSAWKDAHPCEPRQVH